MIDKKLLEQIEKLWIEVDIEILKKKWLPDEVINDILEWSIDWKEWKEENFIDYDEYIKSKTTLSSKKVEICTN